MSDYFALIPILISLVLISPFAYLFLRWWVHTAYFIFTGKQF